MKWSEDEEELLQKLRSLGTQGYPRQGYAEKLRSRLHLERKRKQGRKRNLQKVMVTGVTAASLLLTVQLLTPPPLSTTDQVAEPVMTLLDEKRSLLAPPPSPPSLSHNPQGKQPEAMSRDKTPTSANRIVKRDKPVHSRQENTKTSLPTPAQPIDPIQSKVTAYLGKLLEHDSRDYLPLEQLSDKANGKIVYTRSLHGIPFLGESVSVEVDAAGTVTGVKMTSDMRSYPSELFPDPGTAIPKEAAEKLIANSMHLVYTTHGENSGKPELTYIMPESLMLQANTGAWITGSSQQGTEEIVIDVTPKGQPVDVAGLVQTLPFSSGESNGKATAYDNTELKAAVEALENYLPPYVTQLRLKGVQRNESEQRFVFTWLHQGIPVIDRDYVIAFETVHQKLIGLSGYFDQDPPKLPDRAEAISPEKALQVFTAQYPITLVYITASGEQVESSPVLAYTILNKSGTYRQINAVTAGLEP